MIVGYEGLYTLTKWQVKAWKINLSTRSMAENETRGGASDEFGFSVVKINSGGYAGGGSTFTDDLGNGDGAIMLLDSSLDKKIGTNPDEQIKL